MDASTRSALLLDGIRDAGAVTGAGVGAGMAAGTSAHADSSLRGALTKRDRVANASANARSTASTLAFRAAASTSLTNRSHASIRRCSKNVVMAIGLDYERLLGMSGGGDPACPRRRARMRASRA